MSSYDAVVIGGGPAGLQAALLMARGGTRAIVYDSGAARHLVSAQSHSFLGADGMPPAELRRQGRQQLEPYGTVEFRDAVVSGVERLADGGFRVSADGAADVSARFVVLATGMRDVALDLPDFGAYWGKSVLHCPYCHGWEFRDRALGVLVPDPATLVMALKVTWWSRDVTLFVAPDLALDTEATEALARVDATVERRRVLALVGDAPAGRLEAVELEDGTRVPLDALFHAPKQRQSELVERLIASLDVAVDDDGFIVVDEGQQTSVPGLFAAGDLTTSYQQIVEAARQGHRAAFSIEHALKAGGRRGR